MIELREEAASNAWILSALANARGPYLVREPRRGEFMETIAPGAWHTFLNGEPTVPLRIEHDPTSPVLASTGRSGTMSLFETERGLEVQAELAKDDPDCVAATSKIRRGLLDRMSVAMIVDSETWSEDRTRRTVHAARLGEIRLVVMPADPGAIVDSIRGAEQRGLEVRFSPAEFAVVEIRAGEHRSGNSDRDRAWKAPASRSTAPVNLPGLRRELGISATRRFVAAAPPRGGFVRGIAVTQPYEARRGSGAAKR